MKLNNILYTLLGLILITGFSGCEEDPIEQAPFVSFQTTDHQIGVEADGTATKEISVYTTNKIGTERTFNIVVGTASTADDAFYTIPATVTVPANSNMGMFTLETGSENIGKTIVLGFAHNEDTYTGNMITLTINEVCLQNPVTLSLSFDGYPEETYWELYDANDTSTPLYSAAEGDYTDMSSASELFCLADGDYIFVIYDSYGDGMSDGTNTGGYSLTLSDGNNTVLASGEGSFGPYPTYYAIHEFSL